MSIRRSLVLQLSLFSDGTVSVSRPPRVRTLGCGPTASSLIQLDLAFDRLERRRLPLVLDPSRLSGDERIALMRGRIEYARELGALDACRPKTRADCSNVPRPCPFVSCRWNLYLDVDDRGRITVPRPDVLPEERAESCALDVIEQEPDGLGPADVAAVMGLSREVLARIEERGQHAIACDAELADAHHRAPAAANDVVPDAPKPTRPAPTRGDVRRRLTIALREQAVLDVLAEGPKTIGEIVAALARTDAPVGEWWVRHVCRLLRGRELLIAELAHADGRTGTLRWSLASTGVPNQMQKHVEHRD